MVRVTSGSGISSIISVVLLILIAVSVGIIIYAFATGWVGSRLSGTIGPSTILTIEKGWCNVTLNSCTVMVRNDGSKTVSIVRAYVIDPIGHVYMQTYSNPVQVSPGNVSEVTVNPSDLTLHLGYTYKITLIANDGTEASTTIKAT